MNIEPVKEGKRKRSRGRGGKRGDQEDGDEKAEGKEREVKRERGWRRGERKCLSNIEIREGLAGKHQSEIVRYGSGYPIFKR